MSQRTVLAWKPRQRTVDLLFAVLFVLVALPIHLRSLNVFMTSDELKWTCRSIMFYRGLRSGDLAQTLQTGHPGVITMWLGVPFMDTDPTQDWLGVCSDPGYSKLLRVSPQAPAKLGEFLTAGRRGVAVLTSLALGAMFLLLTRLLGRRVALLAAALMLFDPFFLAHSRLLHLDAIATSFLFLCVLSLAIALREQHRGFMALSGVFAGLAMLNKSPAMFAMPFAAATIGLYWLGERRSFGWLLRSGLTWLLPAIAVYLLLWPAMWVQPIKALTTVFSTAIDYAGEPHANGNFYWGVPSPDPGPTFYPVALIFRLTPWTTLGALLSLPWILRRGEHRRTLWVLGGFALAYALFMTIGDKKFDRYLLPIFPCIQALAAVGFIFAGEWLVRRLRPGWKLSWVAAALVVLSLLLGAATVLPHAPYYLTYYNPLLGGPRAAVKKILVGWGEGLDLGIGYLNRLPGIEDKRACARALSSLMPLYHGHGVDADDYDAATTDYVLLYLNEVQRQLNPELIERYYNSARPSYVGQLQGIDYVWVYENKSYEAPMAYIVAHADPATDAIVVGKPGLFTQNYRDPTPAYALNPGGKKEEALATLQRAAGQAKRIWYVRYAESKQNTTQDWKWLEGQWKHNASLLEERAFTDVSVTLWEVQGSAPFAAEK